MQCRLFFHFCKNCFVCGFSINQLEIKFASHPMHFFFWDSQDIEIVCSSQRAHIGMGHAAPHVALESELVLITLRKEPLALQIMILFATTPAQMSPRPAVCGCLHFFCFLVSYVLLCFCFIRCIFFFQSRGISWNEGRRSSKLWRMATPYLAGPNLTPQGLILAPLCLPRRGCTSIFDFN